MGNVNYLAIAAGTVVAFVFSAAWYIAFARPRARLSAAAASGSRRPFWMMPVELARSLVVAAVLASLVVHLRITDWSGALLLAFALWVGFPVILLSGSVIYENVPWKLAAIHACDWLGKLLIITIIVTVWR